MYCCSNWRQLLTAVMPMLLVPILISGCKDEMYAHPAPESVKVKDIVLDSSNWAGVYVRAEGILTRTDAGQYLLTRGPADPETANAEMAVLLNFNEPPDPIQMQDCVGELTFVVGVVERHTDIAIRVSYAALVENYAKWQLRNCHDMVVPDEGR